MRIHPSARRHGIPDADMIHAIDRHLCSFEVDPDNPPWRVLYLGPACSGNMLEVVVMKLDDGEELVIHADKMGGQYGGLLP